MTQPDQYFPSTSVNADPGFSAYTQTTQADYMSAITNPWSKTLAPLVKICQTIVQLPLFQGLLNLNSGASGAGPLGDILAALDQLSNGAKNALNNLIAAIEAIDWFTPAGVIDLFKALVQFAKDLIHWVIELVQVFLGIIPPQWLQKLRQVFELDLLQADWNQFIDTETGINWSIWDLVPDLMGAWGGLLTFIEQLVQWGRLVLQNISGFDLFQMFAVFDFPDLRAAFANLKTRLLAIDWANWNLVPDLMGAFGAFVQFVQDIVNWGRQVIQNILNGVDAFKMFAVFDLPALRAAFARFKNTMLSINWTSAGAIIQFISAAVKLAQDLGNWLLTVIDNLLNSITGLTSTIHNMFSSVANFISTIIGWVYGSSAPWQAALNLIAGITGATPAEAITAIYNKFLDVLKMFGIDLSGGNPLGIGLPTFDLNGAINNFITNVLNPTGLIGAASDLAQNIIDTIANSFLGLTGTGHTISDLLRAIQSIPTSFLTGSVLPGQISTINVGAISARLDEFLVNPSFDSLEALLGGGIWNWDGTQGPLGFVTSIFTDAASVLREIVSNTIAVAPGQVLNISGYTQWSGFSGAANSIALTLAQFDPTGLFASYANVASIASPGTASSGWQLLQNAAYTVPAGISTIQLRPIVDATATAGRVWFGNMSVKPANTATTVAPPLVPLLDASKIGSGTLAQSFVTNLTTDLSTLTTGVSNAATSTALTNVQSTIISALGGSGSGLTGLTSALTSIPGANIIGSISSVAVNIQNVIDAILSAGNPSYVAGSGTLPGVSAFLAALPQANIQNLVSQLNAKALATDLTNLMSNLGLGTSTLAAITNRLANLSASGTMPQAAITGLTAALSATALQSDLNALMSNLGAGSATLTAITNRLQNLTSAGQYSSPFPMTQITGLANYLSHLNPSTGVIDSINSVTGLPGYLQYITSSGYLNSIYAVLGLSGYLTNMSSGGILNGIGAVQGLSTQLQYITPAGILNSIYAVSGLANYLANMSSSGILNASALSGLLSTAQIPSLPYGWGGTIHGSNVVGADSISGNIVAYGSDSAFIATQVTTTTTSYTTLGGGDSITINIGSSGVALVCITCELWNGSAGQGARASWGASGANNISPGDDHSLFVQNGSTVLGEAIASSWMSILKGLAPGSTTFQMYYERVGGVGTSFFQNRRISVLPL